MKQYKTVAGPVGLTIGKKDSFSGAVQQYAAIIENEVAGGWQLEFIQEVPVTKDKGCLTKIVSMIPFIGSFFSPYETITFNMLVFSKEI